MKYVYANLAGQVMIIGTVYYMAYSTGLGTLAALFVGHILFEGSTYLYQRNAMKQAEALQQLLVVADDDNYPKGNC